MATHYLFTMSEDVFEITDFTTASDWERFVSDLEEVITRWQLCGKDSSQSPITADQLTKGFWIQKHESIRFSKTNFSLIFHKFEENEDKEKEEDNQSVSCPSAALDGQRIEMDFPAKAHCLVRYFGIRSFLVISALDDSVANEDRLHLLLSSATMALSSTQCCIPLLIEWNRRRRLYSGVSLNSNTRIDFQMIQSATQTQRFKHLSSVLEVFRLEFKIQNQINVSIRLSFALNNFPENWIFKREKSEKQRLLRHFIEEPLLELQMAAIWPSLAEDAVIDSENHSDLDPNSAEKWTLRALFRDKMEYPLSECLALLLSLKDNKNQILDEILEEEEIKDALIPLTFDCSKHKWIRDEIRDNVFGGEKEEVFVEDFGLKSAPIGSLGWRVAISLMNVFSRNKQLEDLRVFWREFCHKLRESWELSRPLPHCCPQIDFNFSVFYQKIQMIDSCIHENNKQEEEEEFFDAQEEEEQQLVSPEGRLRISELKRVSDPTQPIWIPETQEAPPITEDMLNEQLAVLQRLGTSAVGANLRARLQSAGLLSDMEAFKAANIDSTFEDFIRWHSPRDCDSSSGQLSPRFSQPGNVWKEVWDSAKPVSAKKQKKLFDVTTEAEKVLHFMTSLSFSDLTELLIQIIINCCLIQLKEEKESLSLDINLNLNFEQQIEEALLWIKNEEVFVSRFQSLLKKFKIVSENKEIEIFVENLVKQPELQIQSFSPFSQTIRKLFKESLLFQYQETSVGERHFQDIPSFPEPMAKEFILRVWNPRPNTYSREVPQRMYCLWSPTEMRIATAFTEDLTYF